MLTPITSDFLPTNRYFLSNYGLENKKPACIVITITLQTGFLLGLSIVVRILYPVCYIRYFLL